MYYGKAYQRQDWAIYKGGCVSPYKDEIRVVPTILSPNNRKTYNFKEPNDNNISFKWPYSGVFKTDDKIQYKLSKEEIIVYLLLENNDE